ncbi:MAG: hypothetical protein HYT70_01405 [Candidatus Aenigmarchaeota archaeon]|nr:hypothetical protein [Candidatus Aenigmarchaeota archaeon]
MDLSEIAKAIGLGAVGVAVVDLTLRDGYLSSILNDIRRAREVRATLLEMMYGNGLWGCGVRYTKEAAFGIYDNFVSRDLFSYFTMREVRRVKKEYGIT